MADKDSKSTSDQRLNKAESKKEPSRRHPEQRQAEQEQDEGFADRMPQQEASRAPQTPTVDHENESDAPNTAGETRKVGAFPVVCIGASAGGLQALESFFAELPDESGIAFVVITHTDPEHASMLPEIIKRKSQVSVHLIENGTSVEPNKIFIPPSNRDPIIEKGAFRLEKRPGRARIHMPIDLFCKNLAPRI